MSEEEKNIETIAKTAIPLSEKMEHPTTLLGAGLLGGATALTIDYYATTHYAKEIYLATTLAITGIALIANRVYKYKSKK